MKIHDHIVQGNLQAVQEDLRKGTAVDALDPEGRTPLMLASTSSSCDIETLRFLVGKGADVNASIPGNGHCSLSLAIAGGNVDKVTYLLQSKARPDYVRAEGHTSVIDAVFSRQNTDQNLFALLTVLLKAGANPRSETRSGQTPIGVASAGGKFEIVRLLLDHGADPAVLKWSKLAHAVAWGTLSELRAALAVKEELALRDDRQRTPWLLSVQTGDLDKVKLVYEAGVDKKDRGHCGKTALLYAVEAGYAHVLDWLLSRGFDSELTDQFGDTALMEASTLGEIACIKVLLKHGANVHFSKPLSQTIVSVAKNLETARILVDAGGDLNEVNYDVRQELRGYNPKQIPEPTPDQYYQDKTRRFGISNPEVMDIPFWRYMVRSGETSYAAQTHFEEPFSTDGPVWCFQRFGQSLNELPDGRLIEIGGEHEDFYDPDFCIYNDVVVHRGDGTFQIFGYPKAIFPPTDFHTATYVNGMIYIIGRIGYSGERLYGETPVYRLDSKTFRIEKIETSGDAPGWIYGHKATLEGDLTLITGGTILTKLHDKENSTANDATYVLNLSSMAWSKK